MENLTERFDRRKGDKQHVLTLAAMDPEADSYEDLLLFAKENDIVSANQIIKEVKWVFSQWERFALEAEVPKKWIQRISTALQ